MSDWDEYTEVNECSFFSFATGLRTLWSLLGEEKNAIARVIVLTVFLQSLDLMVPLCFKAIFDTMATLSPSSDSHVGSLVWIVVAMFLLRGVSMALRHFVKEPMFLRSLIRLENWWPVMAQEKLLALSLGYHEQENTGKKMAKINKGCERLVNILCDLFWGFLPAFFYLSVNCVFILFIDWRLGMLFFVPIVPIMAFTVYAQHRFIPTWEKWEKAKEIASGVFCQSLINVSTVQGYVQEQKEKSLLQRVRKDMEDMDIDASLRLQKYFFVTAFLMHACFMVTIVTGIYFVTIGVSTAGTVVYIIATGNVTIQGVWELIKLYQQIMRNLVAARRMKELLDELVTVSDAQGSLVPEVFEGNFVFDCVCFQYEEKESGALDGFSCKFGPGEMIALVGKSGCGKTTAIKVLCRMYDVTHGEVRLDGIDIRSISRDWYRRLFAVVQQDVDIFEASIAQNIAYSCPQASEAEIVEALTAAHLAPVVFDTNRFPHGMNTQVGERGVRLSGGERQRVGIARAYLALLRGAKVLVLDEATSSLDSEAENAIQEMIERLQEISQISVVAIAHRLSTIQRADAIYVMEVGKIKECGSHEKLMQCNGLYAQLANLQQLGELRE